jgi:ribosomal protein S18 acetylase RimI-like enzyme
VRIRAARPDEAAAIAALHIQADQETYEPIFRADYVAREPSASLGRWQAALEIGDDLKLVEAEGELVGFGHVRGDWMSALYLLAAWKRRGLGARLLGDLCARARSRGVERLRFHVLVENAPAIAFYEAMGGRAVGRIELSEGQGRSWEDFVFELPTAQAPISRAATGAK